MHHQQELFLTVLRPSSLTSLTSRGARAIRTDVMELKTWLILGAAADFLACMRKLNVQTQKGDLRILAVESLLDTTRDYLNKYMTRQTGSLACALRSLFVRPNQALYAQSATCLK